MSKTSSSPMEQGELDDSPDLHCSPQITLDVDDSDSALTIGPVITSRSSDRGKSGRDVQNVSQSPNRQEDAEDVLIIQPPQVQVQRKEKHHRRHKEGRHRSSKEDRYSDDPIDRHASKKADQKSEKYEKYKSKRDEDREIDEHRRKRSQLERERLEKLEMERIRLERESERKYLEQVRAKREDRKPPSKDDSDRKQQLRDEKERKQLLREEHGRKLAQRDELERKLRDEQGLRRQTGRDKERLQPELERRGEVYGNRNRRDDDGKRLQPSVDSGRDRRNRDTSYTNYVPVHRPRSRSRSPLTRSTLSPNSDTSRELQALKEIKKELLLEEQRERRREKEKKESEKELDKMQRSLSRNSSKTEFDLVRNDRYSGMRAEDKQRRAEASESSDDEQQLSGQPGSRLQPDYRAEEAISSHESEASDRSPAANSAKSAEKPAISASRDSSASRDDDSDKSGSDSSSSSSGSSDERSPEAPHNIRSKFDDTVNEARERSASPSDRSSRSASSINDDNDDNQSSLSNSPVPSPDIVEPLLPNYYPALQGCRNVEEFHCMNRIEEGTYGVVYRAKDLKTNEIVALKRLKMEKEKEGFPITSLREINTLLKAQHENIVTVREIVVGSNMDKIYIVMDYVEHDLKSLMEYMKESFTIGEVKTLLIQLLRGVQHMHDNWIIHRDLKTSNLLLSNKGILKIGDFGLAREYGSPLKHYTPIVVTLWYRSPELLLGTKLYSCPIDLWSVGCIFAECITKKPLFPGKSEIDELNRIFKELGTPTEKIWPGVSELPAMKKCTFTDYPYNQLRSRFGSLLSDKGFELLNKFLTYNPERRITAGEALRHEYFDEVPKPIDPSMFPTWPAKSEQARTRSHGNSPKPPSGGKAYAKLLGDDDDIATGFHLATSAVGVASSGAGFALKF